jgi:hypothetical protein
MSATSDTETTSGAAASRFRHRSSVRIGAVVAVGLAAAFVAWLAFGGRGSGRADATTTVAERARTGSATSAATPSIVTVGRLRAVAAASAVPFYWVGSRSGTRLELTRAAGGTVFVRYLPPGVPAGDSRGFLTIATYPEANAFGDVERAATANAASKTVSLAGGGIAVYDPPNATNVHLAYPGQPYQIELYAPQHGLALRLVESGAVRPVG